MNNIQYHKRSSVSSDSDMSEEADRECMCPGSGDTAPLLADDVLTLLCMPIDCIRCFKYALEAPVVSSLVIIADIGVGWREGDLECDLLVPDDWSCDMYGKNQWEIGHCMSSIGIFKNMVFSNLCS